MNPNIAEQRYWAQHEQLERMHNENGTVNAI